MKGKMIIISAPSGAGKTTLVKHLMQNIPALSFSVSATSRKKREGEKNGVDYYFLSKEEFKKKIDNSEFIEWEEVYSGTLYGTLNSEIKRLWGLEQTIIFDVDVMGGLNLKEQFGNSALSIFILPPSIDELKNRLIKRSTDAPETIEGRIAKAELEINYSPNFDVTILNDNLEQAKIDTLNAVNYFIND